MILAQANFQLGKGKKAYMLLSMHLASGDKLSLILCYSLRDQHGVRA